MWYCAIPIVVCLLIGYYLVYCLCKISAAADAHIEAMKNDPEWKDKP